jgi:TonB-dependent receptor
MARTLTCCPRVRLVAAGLVILTTWLVTAQAQTVTAPPAGNATQSPETDIGRVTTGPPSNASGEPVTPSATTSRAAALAEKQQAPNIIDVQPLSEMLKLPDVNLAEALQRVPGISLETDTGEGRFINIRGLDSDLNASSYAGVRLPVSNPSSPFGGSRAVAFDTFPMGIVGGVEVNKTLVPDMDAEGLGGSINLVPRSGAEHGGQPFLDADLGGGYESLRGTPVYLGQVSAGRSFSGGDGIGGLFAGANAFSAVVTAVYHQDSRGIDDVEEGYTDQQSSGVPDKVLSDLELRRYANDRKRYGVAANFDAKATESTSFYLRLLWSGYLETTHKHYLVLSGLDSNSGCTPLPGCIQDPSNPNGYIASTGELQQQSSDGLERIENDLAILGGSSIFDRFKLDYHASFVLGSDRVSSSYGSVWTDGTIVPGQGMVPNTVAIAYDNNTDPRYPTFRTLDGTNPANPAIYNLQEIDLGPSYARDGQWAGAIDATVPTDRGQWKFGLSLRARHTTSESTSPVFTPDGNISLSGYTAGASQVYYNDHYNIGPGINYFGVRQLAYSGLGAIADDAAADASSNTDDNENVYAAYGEYFARFGKFGLLAGLRVESTHATYRGNLYDSDADTNTPATESNSYTNAFPTLQGRYDFADDLTGRLTYSSGIARPGFNQITPGANISVSGQSVSIGNPQLKPTIGQNLDATLEYYPGNGQVAALGLFYKDFSNYILQSQQIVNGYAFPGLTGVVTTVDSYSNGPAHLYGAEGQYQQQLLFLPKPWDGFGYSANITVVDSRAEIHPGIYGLLPSTSQLTWNGALFYERDAFEVRVAADYVGQNLFSFGGITSNAQDVFSHSRLTLDAGASYAVSHHVHLYVDGKNLLNTPLEFTETPSVLRPIQREFYDVTILAGIRVSLE